MNDDPTKLKNVKVGMVVQIEETKNFGSGVLTKGRIKKVLTTFDHQSHGILVVLENGARGHTKEIVDSSATQKIDTVSSSSLIPPESSKIEWKSCFLFVHDYNKDPDMAWIVPHSVYKTIAAFANAEGGELFIGIRDDGKVLGLEEDYNLLTGIYKKNKDGFELKVKHMLSHYFKTMEKLSLDLLSFNFIKSGKKEICKISVTPTTELPLILWDSKATNESKKGPLFYVRKGNSSESYDLLEFFAYWIRHFKAMYDYRI